MSLRTWEMSSAEISGTDPRMAFAERARWGVLPLGSVRSREFVRSIICFAAGFLAWISVLAKDSFTPTPWAAKASNPAGEAAATAVETRTLS